MGFLVPWVVNNSEHSDRLFRRAFQQFVGPGSGVAETGDLRVRALPTPGAGFRVAPGSGMAQSRDTAGSARETYGPVNDAEVVVSGVPGTPSGSGRRDLVILEVTDPQMESVPYPAPSDPVYEGGWLDGDTFCRVTIIQNVDSLVPVDQRPVKSLDQITSGAYANVTGVTLAAINYPASTATIQQSMIEDLRVLQSPKRSEVVFARPRVAADDSPQNNLGAMLTTGGEAFPGGAGYANSFQVDVPEWATRMVIDARWMSLFYKGGEDPRGSFWIEYGDEWKNHTWPNRGVYEYRTQEFAFNSVNSPDARTDSWDLMDEVPVPAKYRGKRITFVFSAGYDYRPSTSSVFVTARSGLGCRITFAQQAIDPDIV